MTNNAYSAYKRQSVTTMTPMEIIVKLYDECEKQLNRSVFFIENRKYEDANKALTKSAEIVQALQGGLNMNIPMSANLDSLYNYFYREIINANVKKDTAIIKTILPMLTDLHEAFTQVSKMSREQIQMQGNT